MPAANFARLQLPTSPLRTFSLNGFRFDGSIVQTGLPRGFSCVIRRISAVLHALRLAPSRRLRGLPLYFAVAPAPPRAGDTDIATYQFCSLYRPALLTAAACEGQLQFSHTTPLH